MNLKRSILCLLALALVALPLFSSCAKTPANNDTPPDGGVIPEGIRFAEVDDGTILVEGQHYAGEEIVIPSVTPEGKIVTQIGAYAFVHLTQLKKVTIPATIRKIDGAAFEGCTGLTEIELPYGLEYIATEAFYGCTALKSVILYSSVFSVGKDVFTGCTALTEMTYKGTVEQWNIGLKYWSPDWIESDHVLTVHCNDGDVIVNDPAA